MTDSIQETMRDYKSKGFAERSGFGDSPCLLVVDFINGFTDPGTPLGGDFSKELAVTNRLLEPARRAGIPVVYTTIAYEPHFRDGGLFIKKVPSLRILVRGSRLCNVDDRIKPRSGELVVEKKFASAFFGTELAAYLRAKGVDTVVMTGCTTSGCIRASAIDSLQYGFHTVVVGDGVGDRAQGPHEANLLDIDAKYGDVVTSQEALAYLENRVASGGMAASYGDFANWWNTKSAPGG